MIKYRIGAGNFWFRVFGYGLNFINRTMHAPPFSVRNNYRKELHIGTWGIQLLKPPAIK